MHLRYSLVECELPTSESESERDALLMALTATPSGLEWKFQKHAGNCGASPEGAHLGMFIDIGPSVMPLYQVCP